MVGIQKCRNLVLTNHTSYNHRKNFLDLPLSRYTYKKAHDLYKIPTHMLYRIFGRTNYYALNSYNDFGLYRAALYHFFNSISFGRKPWVVTYEWTLPIWGTREETNYEKAGRFLAGAPCKKTIAMSEWAQNCQIENARAYYPSFADDVLAKNCVLHPPQVLYIADVAQKEVAADHVTFTMVGHDFFRKGGKEVLSVFDRLLARKYPIKLNIVSRMQYGDFPSGTTKADYERALQVIHNNSSHIAHCHTLPNAAVIELLRKTDVGLLPTYHDTYGYSVLEAQSCGCPVISTDIYALPEINNDAVGWVIDVPLNSERGARISTAHERRCFSEFLENSLQSRIEAIVGDRATIKQKGHRCIAHIRDNHDPVKAAARLEQIYDQAMC